MAMSTVLTVLGRYGRYPAPGGAGRGYLLSGPGGAVLIGCGGGVAGRLGYALAHPADLAAVVLADLRPDHVGDLAAVGSMAAGQVARGERRGLLPVYALSAPTEAWRRLQRPGVLDVRGVGPGDRIQVAGWSCAWTPTAHACPGAALRWVGPQRETLAITGLTEPTAEVREACAGVDILLAEADGPADELDEEWAAGMTSAEAAALAAACGARALLLSHLDGDADPRAALAAARGRFPAAALALEGRSYALGSA